MGKSKKYEWDYCTLSPEKLAGVYLGDACKIHDLDYSSKHPEVIDRKEADLRLKSNIIALYNAKGKKFLGIIVGNIYYFFVRLFGGFYWKTW